MLDALGTGFTADVVGANRLLFAVEFGPTLSLCWFGPFKFNCALKLFVSESKVGCGVTVTPNGPVWVGAGFGADATNGFIVGWELLF